ncbi:MAG: hypothetical protein A3J83_08500 [Elusimicrobia bacterium RIFOXYA2_FULL_40_6]|nr:MAG: hypothetical protein A3J83_08500 [Elusimicrobia bacterium RIFOXYA2_FULL_40_6]
MNSSKLIAVCGMNCGICMAYLRDKNKCPGCYMDDKSKSKSCLNCGIKKCTKRKGNYCFSCKTYPCDRLKHLDKRYRTKYNMSMIENLQNIKELGIRKFVKDEKARWACTDCGGTINVHRSVCSDCGKINRV